MVSFLFCRMGIERPLRNVSGGQKGPRKAKALLIFIRMRQRSARFIRSAAKVFAPLMQMPHPVSHE